MHGDDSSDALAQGTGALLARAGWRPGNDKTLRDASGKAFAVTLLVDKGNPTREQAALAAISNAYKGRFQQQSVMTILRPACVSF